MFRIAILAALLLGTSAFGDTAAAPVSASSLPWDIASVAVVKVSDEATPNVTFENDCTGAHDLAGSLDGLDLGGISLGQIVTIGQEVWKIVEAGRPVVNIKTPMAFALPRGLACWSDLENWQPSRTQTYEAVYKNGFAMEAVKFRFRLQYTYGGGLHGKGRYLANVTVLPAELNVIWGYTFDAEVAVGQAVNLATLDNPMAGMELNVSWNVKTVFKESRNSLHYFVQGDGQVLTAN